MTNGTLNGSSRNGHHRGPMLRQGLADVPTYASRPKGQKRTPKGLILTTGQVAHLMGCAPRTVCEWVDSDQLEGYRLPSLSPRGHGDRRITVAALVSFCRLRNIPIPLGLGVVVVVGSRVVDVGPREVVAAGGW